VLESAEGGILAEAGRGKGEEKKKREARAEGGTTFFWKKLDCTRGKAQQGIEERRAAREKVALEMRYQGG